MVMAEEQGLELGLSCKALQQVPWPIAEARAMHDDRSSVTDGLKHVMTASWAEMAHAEDDGVEIGITYRQLSRVPWLLPRPGR